MKPLIVYIIGDTRSGSTLLDYLLSFHSDATTLGEMHHIHDYYILKKGLSSELLNWKCNCGEQVHNCLFWRDVLKESSFTENFITKLNYKESVWDFLKLFISKNKINYHLKNKSVLKKGKIVAENCWKIYEAVINHTGKPIIIDSSKNANQAYFLFKHKQENICSILLERDIRAVAYSKLNWAKKYEARFGKAKSIYYYILTSWLILFRNRKLCKKIQSGYGNPIVKKIDYLNLATNPQQTINEICSFLSINTFVTPTMANDKKTLDHFLQGSPNRFEKKAIQLDTKWKEYYKHKPFAYILGTLLQHTFF
jgi:hypothetical protein